MKKMIVLVIILLTAVSSAFAIGAGFGVRGMAMGGTGIASAHDTTSAYYNPAGLMFGPDNFQAQVSGGGALSGVQNIIDMIGNGNDFIAKNFDQDINLNGSLNGGLGISVKKVGFGVFATGPAVFNKPANSFNFNTMADVQAEVPLTLGSTFSTPVLPLAQIAVGVNLKAIEEAGMFMNVTQLTPTSGQGTSTQITGSGFGFDIGAQAKVTPLLTVGGVIRNLSASISKQVTTKDIVVNPDGTVTEGASAKVTENDTPAPEVGVGAALLVPITGTLVALDLEDYSYPDLTDPTIKKSYTDTHFGLEQGFFFNAVMLRAGYFTFSPDEDTYYTYGIGINIGPGELGFAAANSQADFHKSQALAELGLSF